MGPSVRFRRCCLIYHHTPTEKYPCLTEIRPDLTETDPDLTETVSEATRPTVSEIRTLARNFGTAARATQIFFFIMFETSRFKLHSDKYF